MKILLACSAGMSTSLVESKMQIYLEEQNIKAEVIAMDAGNAKAVANEWDIIMLGPQVSFMKQEFETISKKPVIIIPPMLYAMAKAKEIVELAIKTLGQNNE